MNLDTFKLLDLPWRADIMLVRWCASIRHGDILNNAQGVTHAQRLPFSSRSQTMYAVYMCRDLGSGTGVQHLTVV